MTNGASESGNCLPEPRVHDLHAHTLPRRLLHSGSWPPSAGPVRVLESAGTRTLRVGERVLPVAPPALSEVSDRLRSMDAAGIDVQVVSPWMELTPVGLRPEQAAAYVRTVNDAVADEVAARPDRLVGMGAVATIDGLEAAAELERILEAGMCGVILPTSLPGQELSDPRLEPLWRTAADRRALVMLHPFEPLAAPRLRAAGLGDLLGTPMENAVAVGALLRSGVLRRHPGLRLCIVHGGGPLPALAGRLDALWPATEADGPRPSDLVRRLYFDTLTHDDAALRHLAEWAGWERVLVGSDFPFPTGDPDAVGRVRRVTPPGSAARRAVLGHTLQTLISEVRTSGPSLAALTPEHSPG